MPRPRTKTRHRFLPTGLDALEDRALLSTLATSPRHLALIRSHAARSGNGQGGQSSNGQSSNGQSGSTQQVSLVNQVLTQVDAQFAQFNTDFMAVEARYFASLDTPPGDGAIDLNAFRSQVGTLASNLSQNVGNVLNNVPGGSGILGTFVTTRLGSDLSASLKGQLTGLEGVGTNGLSKAGFAYAAQNAIGSALNSTEDLVHLYDESLSYAAYGFFSGYFRFAPSQASSTQQTGGSQQQQSGTANLTPSETVLGSIFRYLGNFSQDFRDARSQYFADGDVSAFRDRVGRLVQNLETDTLNAVNAVPGGGGPLSRYLDARIDSTLTGSLSGTLLTLPDFQSTPLGQEGFTLASDTAILNTQLAVQNFVRLYDSSLSYVANGFYQAYFAQSNRGTGGTGIGSGPLTSPGATNGGSSFTPTTGAGTASTVGSGNGGTVRARSVADPSGTVHAMAAYGYYNNPYGLGGVGGLTGIYNNVGGYNSYGVNTGYSGMPTAYDPNYGYGGLGGGFDFGPTTLYGGNLNSQFNVSNAVTAGGGMGYNSYGYGVNPYSFGVSPFGTGVGFGPSNMFTYGYGTGFGVGPYTNTGLNNYYGTGLGSGFTVVSPAYGSTFGGGYGAGAGFGGFYF